MITKPQWRVLELLEPAWLVVKWKFANPMTISSLVQRGWIEVRTTVGFRTVRLTPAGQEVRDMLHRRRARILNRKLWENR